MAIEPILDKALELQIFACFSRVYSCLVWMGYMKNSEFSSVFHGALVSRYTEMVGECLLQSYLLITGEGRGAMLS